MDLLHRFLSLGTPRLARASSPSPTGLGIAIVGKAHWTRNPVGDANLVENKAVFGYLS